jgi:hypothetical protein
MDDGERRISRAAGEGVDGGESQLYHNFKHGIFISFVLKRFNRAPRVDQASLEALRAKAQAKELVCQVSREVLCREGTARADHGHVKIVIFS